jgi:hypothetical protein
VVGKDGLDGNRQAEPVVPRLVDGAHAAATEELDDGVALTDALAGRERDV